MVLIVVLPTRGEVRAWPMKLVRLAYLDTNAVFEREVIRVEIQTIVSPVLEEVGLKARLSGSLRLFIYFRNGQTKY